MARTVRSTASVRMVRAATPSLGAAAVHQGSVETCARMVSPRLSFSFPVILLFVA